MDFGATKTSVNDYKARLVVSMSCESSSGTWPSSAPAEDLASLPPVPISWPRS